MNSNEDRNRLLAIIEIINLRMFKYFKVFPFPAFELFTFFLLFDLSIYVIYLSMWSINYLFLYLSVYFTTVLVRGENRLIYLFWYTDLKWCKIIFDIIKLKWDITFFIRLCVDTKSGKTWFKRLYQYKNIFFNEIFQKLTKLWPVNCKSILY